MPAIPESTKISLTQRLNAHSRERWPQIRRVQTQFRGSFAYVSALLTNDEDIPLMRLRYEGSARTWGFAIYRASHHDYEDSWLPDGQPVGPPNDALDTAAELYLSNPRA